jgi:hypothetical protein
MTRATRLIRLFAAVAPLATCAPASEPGAPVASVSITPGMVNLNLSFSPTMQLSAVARDADGAALDDRAIAWASLDDGIATISTAGVVTAVAIGTTTVEATSEGVSGSVTVVVAAGGPATVLFEEGFEDDLWATRGWYSNGAFATTTSNPRSGSRALIGSFAQGATNVPWNGGRVLFTPTNSLYVRYWVRYSDNWVGSGGTAQPHEFFFLTTENTAFVGPARTRLTVYVEHNYQNGGLPVLAWQDGENVDEASINVNLVGVTEARAVAGCNGNPDGIQSSCYLNGAAHWNWKSLRATTPRFMPTAGAGYKGDWHMVEAYYRLNTVVGGVAQNDGIARYWFDGALVLEATNAQFRTGARPNMLFNQMLLSPYIGPGSSVAQTVWYDDILIATARP